MHLADQQIGGPGQNFVTAVGADHLVGAFLCEHAALLLKPCRSCDLLFCKKEIAGPIELGDEPLKLPSGRFGQRQQNLVTRGRLEPERQ
jgi:hypothetical protein